jgi:hypothetical protein
MLRGRKIFVAIQAKCSENYLEHAEKENISQFNKSKLKPKKKVINKKGIWHIQVFLKVI